MPPGRNKKHVHVAFAATDHALLAHEATLRKTSVNSLVHSAITVFLNPEKAQRGLLLTQMEAVSHQFASLLPALAALERTTGRTEGLSQALQTLRGDLGRAQDQHTRALQELTQRLDTIAKASRTQRLEHYLVEAGVVVVCVLIILWR
jgi:transcriptional regulator with GAF, ATPase, and Fis domain